mgnify:CR=1 FL=1
MISININFYFNQKSQIKIIKGIINNNNNNNNNNNHYYINQSNNIKNNTKPINLQEIYPNVKLH